MFGFCFARPLFGANPNQSSKGIKKQKLRGLLQQNFHTLNDFLSPLILAQYIKQQLEWHSVERIPPARPLMAPNCYRLTVMWSETVGLRTRPVWDQKYRSWSWFWSCRSGVVLWNTVLSRSSS